MYLVQAGSDWEVRTPAKLNLLLKVIGRRDDGFHEIETLMVPVDLFDSLVFVSRPTSGIQLTCQWAVGRQRFSRLTSMPEGSDNIVVRAVALLRDRAGVSAGAQIRLLKRIPSGAGLGGGSSDAAASLMVANRAWRLGWSRESLAALAAELGSDVPFFLSEGSAICRGRGERVERLGALGRLYAVVVCPPVGLSTADVYRAWRPIDSACCAMELVGALRRGDLATAAGMLSNGLQDVAARMSPWIGRLIAEFNKTTCLGHQMTGSGSGYFGVFRAAREARCVAARLRSRDLGGVYSVNSWG